MSIEGNNSLRQILVVEDDELSQEVIVMFLNGLYETYTAGNTDEALRLIEEYSFSVILMDINLGAGMTGIDLAKIIRQLPAYVDKPIIATTAFVMESNKEEFISSGFNDYLAKPFSRKELLAVIAKNLKS